jgi:hypothetical protein
MIHTDQPIFNPFVAEYESGLSGLALMVLEPDFAARSSRLA